MKKNISIILVIILSIILVGCGSTNDKKETTNEEKTIEKEKKEKTFDEKLANLTNYVISKQDVKVSSKEFEEVYYIVENDNQNINLFINNDGSMFEYSNKKFLSTNSNVKKYISKLKAKVIMGFANFGSNSNSNQKEGEYWFILEDYSLARFDSINDVVFNEKEIPNDGWGRVQLVPQVVKILKNKFNSQEVISWSDHLNEFIVISKEKMYLYVLMIPGGDYSNTSISIKDERELPIDEIIEKIYSSNFIKTNRGYYIYKQINIDKTKEFIDAKPIYAFEKIDIYDIYDEISFWNNMIMVTKNGEVYYFYPIN